MANTITLHTLNRAFSGSIKNQSFVESGADYRAHQKSGSLLDKIANLIADLFRPDRDRRSVEIADKRVNLRENFFSVAEAILKFDGQHKTRFCVRNSIHEGMPVEQGVGTSQNLNKEFEVTCNAYGFITISEGPHSIEIQHNLLELKRAMLREYLIEMRDVHGQDEIIDLTHFDLADTDLSGLDLHNCNFSGAVLNHANFQGCDLRGANFALAHAEGANFTGARLARTTFAGATLREADFSGCSLRGIDFSYVVAERVKFVHADLTSAHFTSATLDAANFSYAQISEARFKRARLERTNLTKTTATRTNFEKAKFKGATGTAFEAQHANFTGADFVHVEFHASDFRNTIFTDANFHKVKLFDVVLLGHEIDSRQKKQVATIETVVKIQSIYRRHLTAGKKESPEADVVALRHEGRVIAYKIKPRSPGVYPWVAYPSEREVTVRAGSSKILTHKSKEYVGLTLRDGFVPDPKNDTLDETALDFIAEKGLSHIVPQYKINGRQYISPNLGDKNLYRQVESREYVFDPAHFVPLAKELQVLHDGGYMHRDIKPQNMIFVGGAISLFDLDTVVHLAFVENGQNITTIQYIHPTLRDGVYKPEHGQFRGYRGDINGMKIDQYAFFYSLFSASHANVSGEFRQDFLDSFVDTYFPCSLAFKTELKNFLRDPVGNDLFHPLSEYLTPPR